MSKAYREWLDRIKDIAAKRLMPSLKNKQMIVDEGLFRQHVAYDVPYHLAGVQNFSGLIPVSQRLSKPIYELTENDGNWSGARWFHKKNEKEYGIQMNIREADEVYTNLSKAILGMIGAE
jgi:hypothetical protein